MDHTQKNEILKLISELSYLDTQPLAHSSTESRSLGIVKLIVGPLLAEEGYATQPVADGQELDLIAERPATGEYKACSIGIFQKHYFHGQVDVSSIEGAIHRLADKGVDRALVVANQPFSDSAHNAARRASPGTLELLDINGLRAWVGRIDVESDVNKLEIEQILKVVSNRFAALIAADARNLDKLEWRQVEQLVADIFDGMGFKVTLTPGSKDEGKDVILECKVQGKERTYIVEIKHWRSRQRVLGASVKHFLNVLVREQRAGGLFLSTYGYANNAFESLTEIERKALRFGEESKLVSLCKTYKKIQSGIFSPPADLTDLVYADTV